ncbi:hypothetical protein MHC_03135 [Mycoplasma haemocanis str. Illinois]|uniref:Uncharacterized protein n=1 Tax=Mycoplasma haemocanis (strain Illinois) TaxID=1111676 RepID=H6N765_MYCHN|nr:hypothetical protein [Mycoplasma haemocanis]AEW45487.1 hypothetical protein MHC_03135 [Mycoplasma haemocanis str. Illinois]
MSKILLSGSVLTVGTGLGLGVSAIGGARSIQIIPEKSEKDSILDEVKENTNVITPNPSQIATVKCNIYSVHGSGSEKDTSKLEGEDFLSKEIMDESVKQQVQEACSKSGQAYVYKSKDKWIYRSSDEVKQEGGSSTSVQEEQCLLYAVQSDRSRTVKKVDKSFLDEKVKDVSEKKEIEESCTKTKKAYLANLGSKGWGYRPSDQTGSWKVEN